MSINTCENLGSWDLIPSEILDLLYESGVPRDISCNMIESLPGDLWAQIQLSSIKSEPTCAKICNALTAVLAYLMQNDFNLSKDADLQLGTAFQYLQGKVSEQRILGKGEEIDRIRGRLDKLLNRFLDDYYADDEFEAANQAIH